MFRALLAVRRFEFGAALIACSFDERQIFDPLIEFFVDAAKRTLARQG